MATEIITVASKGSALSAADHDANIVNLAATADAAYANSSTVLNVLDPDYGAVGDGTTDDTQAVLDAIADANDGDTIFFGRATAYKLGTLGSITKQLVFDFGGSFVYLSSASPLITIGAQGEYGRGLIIRNARFKPFIGYTGVSTIFKVVNGINTLIEDCSFNDITASHSLIWNEQGYGLTVRKCQFRWNTAPAVIYLSSSSGDATYSYNFNITNIDISNMTGHGIVIEGGDGSINHSVIEGCSGDGIRKTNGYWMFKFSMSDLYFESNSGQDINFTETTVRTIASVRNCKFIGDTNANNVRIMLGSGTRIYAQGNFYQYGGVSGPGDAAFGSYIGVQNTTSQAATGFTGLRELSDVMRAVANGYFFYSVVDPYYPAADNGVHDLSMLRVGHGAGQITKTMYGTKTWTPGVVADGAVVTTTVTVTGAALFDMVVVGFTAFNGATVYDGFLSSGQVSAADTVTVTLLNKSGAQRSLDAGFLKVLVIKATA